MLDFSSATQVRADFFQALFCVRKNLFPCPKTCRKCKIVPSFSAKRLTKAFRNYIILSVRLSNRFLM